MEKRTRFSEKKLQDAQGRWLELQYYLLAAQQETGTVYGVEIRLEQEGRTECSRYQDVTTRPERMAHILEVLTRNTVTPVTLADVLEDLL